MGETIGVKRRGEITEAIRSKVRTGDIDPQSAGALLFFELFDDGVMLGKHGIDLDMPAEVAGVILEGVRNCGYHSKGACLKKGCMALNQLHADLAANQDPGVLGATPRSQAVAFVERCRKVGCSTPPERFDTLIVQFPE